MIEARMVEKVLTDGSKVYDIHIRQMFDVTKDGRRCDGGDEETLLILPANTAADADRFVAEFVAMVNRHTGDVAERTD